MASRGLDLLVDESRAEAAEWRRYIDEPSPHNRIPLFDRYRGLAQRMSLSEWHRCGKLGLEKCDTDQLAYEALLNAIDRFDPCRGIPFSAYVRLRIRGAIRNAMQKATEANAIYGAKRRIERDRLRSLKVEAEATNSEAVDILRELVVGIALGLMVEDAGSGRSDELASSDASAYDSLAWSQMTIELNRRIGDLPERERFILQYHYQKDVSFTEIANLLGISKGRVSQIHAQAVKRLRKNLAKFR